VYKRAFKFTDLIASEDSEFKVMRGQRADIMKAIYMKPIHGAASENIQSSRFHMNKPYIFPSPPSSKFMCSK
jgi:hypothetical protein